MIQVVEHQDALLELWRRGDERGIRLAHVDFHDDLRGLLVDRRRGRGYAVARGVQPPDSGNYLAHAVLEGRVTAIRWVHALPGGRGWDLADVRYERDVRALGDRLMRRVRRDAGAPLEFCELVLDEWRGPTPGERLSVDWDCFASFFQDAGGVSGRVDSFFRALGDARPEHVYAAYSSGCVPPNLPAFRRFVERLSETLEQPVEWLSPGLLTGELAPLDDVVTTLPESWLERSMLALRRRGWG